MILAFCRDPLEPARPDRSFSAEVAAAEQLGLASVLVDHDALTRGEPASRIARGVAGREEPATAVYRGWMTTPEQYEGLHGALASRGVHLINDPQQYRAAHHLPGWYGSVGDLTPRSVWITGDLSVDRSADVLTAFGDAPAIVKDFVKSRKHEWDSACFIPSASDREAVARVVGRFLELQGDDLAGGLVFREFVEFRPIGVHPKSGMPIVDEHRIFWLDREPIFQSPYWEGVVYEGDPPDPWAFVEAVSRVESRFVAMDVARRRDGRWMIVELGDGQVSGLPREADARPFLDALRGRLHGAA